MDHHRGHKTGIVAVPTGDSICGDEPLPLALQRDFRQQNEEPLEGMHLPHRLLNCQAKAVVRRWPRRNGPEFNQILRYDVQRFISGAKRIERPIGDPCVCGMRLRYPQ